MNIPVTAKETNSMFRASFGSFHTVSDGSYLKKGLIWYCDSDRVVDSDGVEYGTLEDCVNDSFIGFWFFVRTESSEAGSSAYPSKYKIDGANGYINLRDYVVWTGKNLLRVNTYEAKASTIKNADGKYSPKSGVDGLMSSTMAAYLTDLINQFWGKGKGHLPVYLHSTEINPDWKDGYLINWVTADGIYMGGIKKDCGGHPPVVNENHTSWAFIVLNGVAETGVYPHRLCIAFDISNYRILLRKGWHGGQNWADDWYEVGTIADGTIVESMLSEAVKTKIDGYETRIKALETETETLNSNIASLQDRADNFENRLQALESAS